MDLVYEATWRVMLERRDVVGQGPFGVRAITFARSGSIEGARLNGVAVGPCGDWILIGPDGYGRLDVRWQFLTNDGAVVYVSYTGLVERNEKQQAAGAHGGETSFTDHYFRIAPRMECGDPRYAWVNTTLFVGRGRMIPGGVEFEVFRVT